MFSFLKAKPLKIDRVINADVPRLSEIHAQNFARGWTQDEFTSLLDDKNTLMLCLRQKAFGKPQGFIVLRVAADEAEILTLIVDKIKRGKGEGRRLLQASLSPLMAKGVTQLFLEVESENKSALKLYHNFGFKQVGIRKGYYEGKDALIMKKLVA
jgi:[ribosomal protein S18]-alanine N-acetyltransferase